MCVTFQLQDLLKDFDQPVHIELDSFKPAAEPGKTEVLFRSFDAKSKENVLPIDDQHIYIHSLNSPNINVRNGVIYWEGN